MSLDTMQDLLACELQDLCSAKTQLIRLLPVLARGAGAPSLRRALLQFLRQSEHQLLRLEDTLADLGRRPHAAHARGMEGMLNEGRSVLCTKGLQRVVDAALISVARRIVHYEIALYGSAADHSVRLKLGGASDRLQQSLLEVELIDAWLAEIAASEVDARAMLALVESNA